MSLGAATPLLLVGAGKMGGALLQGWLDGGIDPAKVTVVDPAPSPEIAARMDQAGVAHRPLAEGLGAPAMLVIAVKPQQMASVLPALAPVVGPSTVTVSIAAGTTIAALAAGLGQDRAIVRAMPNTPAQVGRGMTVACANANVPETARSVVTALLGAVGRVAWIDEEALMDAVTAVSGSGPAYVFLLAECLTEAGIRAGLPADLAEILARETVAGAGELLHRSELPAETLRRNVTSPGGTTAAALGVLMREPGLGALLVEAVAAAARRSRELAG